jgi:hypothetical protein
MPGSRIVAYYGGYVIEENGVIVFACDEKMSEEVGRSEDLVGMLYDDIVGEEKSHLPGKMVGL